MANVTPNSNDVLFGRGATINHHTGNQQFRSLVISQQPNFIGKSKAYKRAIAIQVFSQIQSLDPPGRFLVEDRSPIVTRADDSNNNDSNTSSTGIHSSILNKTWLVVEREKSIDKIMHRLREKTDAVDTAASIPVQLSVYEGDVDVDIGCRSRDTSIGQLTNNSASISPREDDVDEAQVQGTARGLPTELSLDMPNNATLSGPSFREPFLGQQVNDSSAALHHDMGKVVHSTSEADLYQYLEGNGVDFELDALVQCPTPQLDQDSSQHHASISTRVDDVGEVQVQGTARGLPTELSLDIPNDATLSVLGQQVNDTSAALHDMGTVVHSTSEADLYQYLEASGVDFELDALVQCPTPQIDQDSSQLLRQYTLQQWIEISLPDLSPESATAAQLSPSMKTYIKSALLVALKLIERILVSEKDGLIGQVSTITIESITPENIMIGTKSDQDPDEAMANIEYVWIMSIIADDLTPGDVMSRLFAVGKLLYYLFSAGVAPMVGYDTPASQKASMDSINLNSEAEIEYSPKKKHHLRAAHAGEEVSNCVAMLVSNGVPWSLCGIIRNLLDSRLGPFCEDDTYISFADLYMDLQLMVENPSCYLDNIRISAMPKLSIPDKLYGREEQLIKLAQLYQNHVTGKSFNGAIISGGSGAGKSKLAMHMQMLSNQSNGYYLSAKFEHNHMSLKPLSKITNLFDSLCEMLSEDCSYSELAEIEQQLMLVLGNQTNLVDVIPHLNKLMPSNGRGNGYASLSVDSSISMRYLLSELLRVMSLHSKPITIVIDDIQFADPASLQLVGSLLLSAQSAPIFFALCHRDDEISMSESFTLWLESIAVFHLQPMKVESITPVAANNLISETLHLSPRLTRPLSSALHNKTLGNPLFLRQLLDSLTEQGYIYINMEQHRWVWDLDKIMELEISDSVAALLVNDIQRLPKDMQIGLQIASCIGTDLPESILGFASQAFGLDLKDILWQVSKKGFMVDVAGSTSFRFAHDKIQEAVYEMMPAWHRRQNHMRLGLTLCTQSLNNIDDNEELFFAAVNQINQGGPDAVFEPSQKNIIAELNLKAGRRSIDLSDYNTAFDLFVHGISFLGPDHWLHTYDLSIELYNAVTDAALVLNNLSAVTLYSNAVVSQARCIEDKLNCMLTSIKAVGVISLLPAQSIEAAFALLAQCGEHLPRSMEDVKLTNDIDRMVYVMQSTPDDTIYSMQENNDKKMTILIDIYAYLGHVLQFFNPWLVGSVSLRMVELTIETGLSAKSPLAFANFGGVLVTTGRIYEGCRLGRLALKLVERKGSLQFKSRVIRIVYDRIFWASEPLQSIVESYSLGHKVGQQSGDGLYAFNNLFLGISTGYFAGQPLDVVQKIMLGLAPKLQNRGVKIFYKDTVLLLSTIKVLQEGLHMSAAPPADNMPSEEKILAMTGPGPSFSSFGKVNHLARAFLFRRLDDASVHIDISGTVTTSHNLLNLHLLIGYFFEGLASFQLARQTCASESEKWIVRGQSVLTKMRCWSEHSQWNWENKMLLLDAERLFTIGEFNKAGSIYENAIRSAREHKFVHEEAIASELAGMFYHERDLKKSVSYLAHSVGCYEKWGAHAVARRVKAIMQGYVDTNVDEIVSSAGAGDDKSLEYLFESNQVSQKKRPQIG